MNRFAPFLLVVACLILPLMITGESFWIDEGSTVLFARMPDLSSWWQHLRQNTTSDAQMPLSMLFAWLGDKLIGSNEWQLRALNIGYGVVALLGVANVGRRFSMPWLPLFFAIQPFLWFYTNEARAYVLQIAIGSWLLVGMVDFLQNKGQGVRWAWIISAAGVLLCYATMLAPATLIPLILVGLTIAVRNRWNIQRRAILVLCGSVLAAVPAGAHYAATLFLGAKGSQLWPADPRMVAYIGYEITGFAGLGPAIADLRDIIRNRDVHVLLSQYRLHLLSLALCSLAFCGVLFTGFRRGRQRGDNRIAWAAFAVFLASGTIFFVASYLSHKPFWARHFSPVFPFYVFCLAWLIAKGGRTVKPWAMAFCCFAILSSLSFRFAPRHRKEDYRYSAELAKAALARGESVWWIAGPEAGETYGVPLTYLDYVPGQAFSAPKKTSVGVEVAKGLQELPLPDLIIMSKPDIFDNTGIAQKIIREHSFLPFGSAKGFQFFRRQAPAERS